jgi:Protein tyrosine and serine/threonine kinase
MATSKDLRQADPPNVEDRSFDTLTSFWRSRIFSQSATPAKAAAPDLHYDFISFLGVAQRLRIDFLPITWQPALDKVGEGGTADIRQALINLQMSFAFKRLKWPRQVGSDESRSFLALISEVSILGHPSIRNHPNIIKLDGICWDISPDDEKVWPVLVFEKAQNGDLDRFMNSDTGKSLCLEERLKLCSDIATAVKDMHSYRELFGSLRM